MNNYSRIFGRRADLEDVSMALELEEMGNDGYTGEDIEYLYSVTRNYQKEFSILFKHLPKEKKDTIYKKMEGLLQCRI